MPLAAGILNDGSLGRFNMTDTKEAQRTRFCMSNQPSPLVKYDGGFSIRFSFYESVGFLYEKITGLKLFSKKSQYGSFFMRALKNENELKITQEWLDKHKETVFLKTTLDCCLALGMARLKNDNVYTELGALEHAAKEVGDEAAMAQLIARATKFIQDNPVYSPATFIAAVPHSTPKPKSLPEKIAEGLATNQSKKCLVDTMSWANKHQSLQETGTVEEKQRQLESFGFTFTPPSGFNGATVILVDDLYQSGSTMEYVAAKLKQYGASKVMGLAMVKSLSNSANTVSKK
jgi:hypothetical protein